MFEEEKKNKFFNHEMRSKIKRSMELIKKTTLDKHFKNSFGKQISLSSAHKQFQQMMTACFFRSLFELTLSELVKYNNKKIYNFLISFLIAQPSRRSFFISHILNFKYQFEQETLKCCYTVCSCRTRAMHNIHSLK